MEPWERFELFDWCVSHSIHSCKGKQTDDDDDDIPKTTVRETNRVHEENERVVWHKPSMGMPVFSSILWYLVIIHDTDNVQEKGGEKLWL